MARNLPSVIAKAGMDLLTLLCLASPDTATVFTWFIFPAYLKAVGTQQRLLPCERGVVTELDPLLSTVGRGDISGPLP